ncbi:MAG: LacI family transcriptional regulator [Spirochaetia bacterium]|nr:LacI family transcriptional regulator [Spirochaetia bacterium]
MRKKVTRKEVAKAAGVAESTVSRALNDSKMISLEVRERVKQVARELGYIPNRQAVLLASNRTYRLGLVVRTYKSFSPFSRAYFPRLLDGVLLQAEQHKYTINIILDKVEEEYKDLSTYVYGKEVDGLVFSVSPLGDPRFEELKQKRIPFVLLNNKVSGMNCVNSDPCKGTREAVRHAVSLGHRRLGYITGDLSYWDGRERLKAFTNVCREMDLQTEIAEGNFSKTSGYRASDSLLNRDDPVSVIFCASDREAMGVFLYCKERGLEVPRDVSIIGFDNLGPAKDTNPPLTTIHQPITKMGSEAVRILISIIEGETAPSENGELRSLDTGFIIRHSTGVCRQ